MKRKRDKFRGCLIGGAIGDALGWPVEFLLKKDIIDQYGSKGITELKLNNKNKAEITDDTQMSLFTAEGILRARTRGELKGIIHRPSVLFYAYQRWLLTQGYDKEEKFEFTYDGYLLEREELYNVRAPGNSCISALRSNKIGTIDRPINDSKGCGGVMRVAPAGLYYDKEFAFEMGKEFAALTHGHPSGYLSAGALAYLIALIIEGNSLNTVVNKVINKLNKQPNSEECVEKLEVAQALATQNVFDEDAFDKLGEGWIGEEALGIAVYCSLKYKDNFKKALIAAVNHDGDSDSTGSITGNILGAYLGIQKIPIEWIDKVELKDLIIEMADDLLTGYSNDSEWFRKYPGH